MTLLLDKIRNYPDIGDHLFSHRPTWLWNVEKGKLEWANPATVSYFDCEGFEQLYSEIFKKSLYLNKLYTSIAQILPKDGRFIPHVLRHFLGMRAKTINAICSMVLSNDGHVMIMVVGGEIASFDPVKSMLDYLPQELGASRMAVHQVAENQFYLVDAQGNSSHVDDKLRSAFMRLEQYVLPGGQAHWGKPVASKGLSEFTIARFGEKQNKVQLLVERAGKGFERYLDQALDVLADLQDNLATTLDEGDSSATATSTPNMSITQETGFDEDRSSTGETQAPSVAANGQAPLDNQAVSETDEATEQDISSPQKGGQEQKPRHLESDSLTEIKEKSETTLEEPLQVDMTANAEATSLEAKVEETSDNKEELPVFQDDRDTTSEPGVVVAMPKRKQASSSNETSYQANENQVRPKSGGAFSTLARLFRTGHDDEPTKEDVASNQNNSLTTSESEPEIRPVIDPVEDVKTRVEGTTPKEKDGSEHTQAHNADADEHKQSITDIGNTDNIGEQDQPEELECEETGPERPFEKMLEHMIEDDEIAAILAENGTIMALSPAAQKLSSNDMMTFSDAASSIQPGLISGAPLTHRMMLEDCNKQFDLVLNRLRDLKEDGHPLEGAYYLLKLQSSVSPTESAPNEPPANNADSGIENSESTVVQAQDGSNDQDENSLAITAERFSWRMDSRQRFLSISAEAEEILGLDMGEIVGRSWTDVAGQLDEDSREHVHQLLNKRDTWSGVKINWPNFRNKRLIEIEFAALPVYQIDRNFEGYRGYCLCVDRGPLPVKAGIHTISESAFLHEETTFQEATQEGATQEKSLSETDLRNFDTIGRRIEEDVSTDTSAQPINSSDDNLSRQTEEPLEHAPYSNEDFDQQPLDGADEVEMADSGTKIHQADIDPDDRPKAEIYSFQSAKEKEAKKSTDETEDPDGEFTDEELKELQAIFSPSVNAEPGSETGQDHDADLIVSGALTTSESSPENSSYSPILSSRVHAPVGPDGEVLAQDETLRLLNAISVPVVVQQDNVLLFVNRAMLKLFGVANTEEFQSHGGLDYMLLDPHNHFVEAEDADRDLMDCRDSKGSLFRARVMLDTIRWGNKPAAMMHFYLPSEFTAAEPKTQKDGDTQSNWRVIAELSSDGVLLLGGDGMVLEANDDAALLFNCTRQDLVGKSITELLSSDSLSAGLDYLNGLLRGGVNSILREGRELKGKHHDGKTFPMHLRMYRSDEDGLIYAAVHDLSYTQSKIKQLKDRIEQAEYGSRKKSEFIAQISHEIRTSLNSILGFVQIMGQHQDRLPERLSGYVKDIQKGSSHMLELTRDLMDLSSIELGGRMFHYEQINLNDIIQDCVGMMSNQAHEANVILRTSLSRDVPPVVADTQSIRQAVLNLIVNAVDHSGNGGQVIVSTKLNGQGDVMLNVRDTGAGMDQEEVKEIMTPFGKLHKAPGADTVGLGLPLARTLAEANRALFEILSNPEDGTLISLTFPATRTLPV